MKRTIVTGIIIVCAVFAIQSCNKEKKKPDDTNNLDRKPMLEHYANNYIVPVFAAMQEKMELLQGKISEFGSNPSDATLDAARAALDSAYMTWQYADMVDFGPANEMSLRSYINIYPVTTTRVESNIASSSYDLETFGNRDAQGFPALDYLLSGIGSTDAEIIGKYTNTPDAANRKKYLADVTAKMLEKIKAVHTAWQSYKGGFATNTGNDANSSLSQMVNGFVMYYERYLRSGKVGLPVGAMTGIAKPELTESYYQPERSKRLAIAAMTAVQRFYRGYYYGSQTTGQGMYDYLSAIGTKSDDGTLMADVVMKEMDEAIAALQGIKGTIRNDVQNDRSHMLTVYEELQDVIPLLKVDMVSAFSISITYTDNDGD